MIAILGILLTAAAPLGAAAEPSMGTFTSAEAPSLTGLVTLQSASGALVLRNHSSDLQLSFVSGSLEVVTVRVRVVSTPMGNVAMAPERSSRTFEGVAGPVGVVAQENFVFVATLGPSAPSNRMLSNGTVANAVVAPDDSGFAFAFRMNANLPYFYQSNLSGPGFHSSSSWSPTVAMDGAGDVFVARARVSGHARDGPFDILLDDHAEPLTPQIGQDAGRVDVYSFARFSSSQFAASANLRDDDSSGFFAATRSLHLLGSLSCADCSGSLETPSRTFVANSERSVLEGDFTVEYLPDSQLGAFTVTGEVTSARMGRGIVYASPSIVEVGLVMGVLAFLLSLSSLVRAAGGRLAGVFFTRLRPNDVLKSAERAALLRAVSTDPGVHLRELQRALGFGWGKLHYHLGVLERSRLIELTREGKHVHAFCVGEARVVGLHSLKLRGAAMQIYEAVRDQGPQTQAGLALSLGLSRQLVGHHLRSMERDGFVVSDASHPSRYSAALPANH